MTSEKYKYPKPPENTRESSGLMLAHEQELNHFNLNIKRLKVLRKWRQNTLTETLSTLNYS